MNSIQHFITTSTLVFLLVNLTSCHKNEAVDLTIELGKTAKHSVFSGGDSISIWGGSVIKGDNGLYHMYYSRWPKKLGWEWVTNSEIAHATSHTPFGPFKHVDVALPDRGNTYWDGSCTHNPTIHKFGNKYYLYYMGNYGDNKIVSTPVNPKINWVHRNNQRIGVAVADDPNGPWTRFDKPVLDITHGDSLAHDALMTSNPSVCEMTDGRILMVYKAVGKKYQLPFGGPVVHLVAIADSPTGPFKKYPNPIFLEKGERFPAEDPYIWHQAGKYHAIVKFFNQENKKRRFYLAHYLSFDGIDWQKAKNFIISDKTIYWQDGSKQQFDHLERPQLYIEDGKAVALICAADTIDNKGIIHSFNIQIPLKISETREANN